MDVTSARLGEVDSGVQSGTREDDHGDKLGGFCSCLERPWEAWRTRGTNGFLSDQCDNTRTDYRAKAHLSRVRTRVRQCHRARAEAQSPAVRLHPRRNTDPPSRPQTCIT